MIENVQTGERIEFETQTPQILVMHTTWTRRGQRAVEHIHPEMQETFEVLEGHAAFMINGQTRMAAAGDAVVVPPGTRHLAWNPSEQTARLRITMRPALRWAEFTQRLFAGEDPGSLLREFSREVQVVDR